VKPMPKVGWTLETTKGDYAERYDLHGKAVTSGVRSVTWSGGSLPDEFYDEFVLSGTLANVEEGQKLFFKTLQECDDGEVAWNEEPAEGQDPHSLEHPAPSLTILAAGGGVHGHGSHSVPVASDAVAVGDLTITGAWARAMLPGQPAGGGYLTIANKGQVADKLVSASSPSAGKVEIHTMEVVNDVMVMRPLEGGLDIPAGATVELKPGGLHVMFKAVKEPFKEGGSVPVALEFEKAGKVEVMLPVQAKQGTDEHVGHGG
jgi:periplasmic copper chaperone A